ncbi:glycoside hydrolase family protein [Devosia soli]|uniref:glycoside hydrolase family protein n=1 Tax=Devosia soli TaxID=361041 RepID=UPI00069A6855|nr:peptidoglycan-binding protein [Devosia soli]
MASTKITQFIGGHEGFVSTYYLDPVHVPTIGYGFTWGSAVFRNWWQTRYGRKFQRGDTISQADAHSILKLIIETEAAPPVDAKIASAKANVRDASYSMVYNAGAGSLKWKWFQALIRGDIKGAAALWRKTAVTAKGKWLPGIARRRNEEADIAEFNRWPSWLGQGDVAPATHTPSENVRQAQLWLKALGYEPGPADGVPGQRTKAATLRFQQDHGALKVDGVIGPATLAALQRTIDLRKKAGGTVAAGGTTAGAGATENATGAADGLQNVPDGVGDWLLWGGVSIVVIGLIWLAWRYRDEINATLRRLA